MKKFIVDDKPYFTICSIHSEIQKIFTKIDSIKPWEYNTTYELYNEILKITKFGIDYSDVAKEMGQHMEDALNYKYNEGTIGLNMYNLNFITEEDL